MKEKLCDSIIGMLSLFLILIIIFLPDIPKKEIQKYYGKTVEVIQDTSLYCKKKSSYQECGQIKKGTILKLDSSDFKNSYFLIEKTPYYVFYKTVIPSRKKEKRNPFLKKNKSIIGKNFTLLQDGKERIIFEEKISFPIVIEEEKGYQILFQDELYWVSKSGGTVTLNRNETKTATTKIPILYYDDALDNKQVVEQLKYMKEKGYQFLTLMEYQIWKQNRGEIGNKSVLLLGNEKANIFPNEIQKDQQEYLYQNLNSVSTREMNPHQISRYQIRFFTSLEKLQEMLDGKHVLDIESFDESTTAIPVINYHFFYHKATEHCGETICLPTEMFEEQLKYLKENNYYTLTMEEFLLWKEGKLEVPKKSVLLTVDDGAYGTGKQNGDKLGPILSKYDMHGVLFLITSFWDIENYRYPNLEIESHSYNLHVSKPCRGINQAAIICDSSEEVIKDLKKSIEIVGSNRSFCFPFYAYNEKAIQNVKDAGFKLAFIGGNHKAKRDDDNYRIPRFPIYESTSLNNFIEMIS